MRTGPGRFERWAGRAFAALAIALGGCASIAGLEEPAPTSGADATDPKGTDGAGTQPPTASSGVPGDPGAQGTPGTSTTTSTTIDGGASTPPPPPVCTTRKPDGETCTSSAECCGKCNEVERCVTTCAERFGGCNPADDAPCCVGLYCSAGFCATCIRDGDDAPSVFGKSYPQACCSKRVGRDGKCGGARD